MKLLCKRQPFVVNGRAHVTGVHSVHDLQTDGFEGGEVRQLKLEYFLDEHHERVNIIGDDLGEVGKEGQIKYFEY